MISFSAFFQAVHGYAPYPWQQRLASRCAAGRLPGTIAVPTGSGKTATIDALIWALAVQAADPQRERRTLGVRIVWAIDRRILVDQVHERATVIATKLADALSDTDNPLHGVADALASLAGEGALPLLVTRWRGGIDLDREIPGPSQPQVITSTVAQVASRLLFRGYGLSATTRTVAAGLVANDTTICIDEAHLAEPLRQTVGRIAELQDGSLGLPALQAVTLTATPGGDDDDLLILDEKDRADERLSLRLTAPKTATLRLPSGEKDAERVSALVEAVIDAIDGGAQTVACVVNTVRQARDVHRVLNTRLGSGEGRPVCELLIGPQRPVDRREFLDGVGRRLFDRTVAGPPVVCVATQTFEVGLDADVDVLVTESASTSALIQRFGRLNRSGAVPGGGRATIVRDEGSWLYGDEERAAWTWLDGRAGADGMVDVSVAALERAEGKPRPVQRDGAPELTPDVVERLLHSAPDVGPWQALDVEVYWRGVLADPGADVAVCWRADLRPEHQSIAGDGYRQLLLAAAPPQRDEQLTLTVRAARALLAALHPVGGAANAVKAALSDADIEGEEAPTATPAYDPAVTQVPFVVIRGREVRTGALGEPRRSTEADEEGEAGEVLPSGLRAGDVIVIPTQQTVDPTLRSDDRAADLHAPDNSEAPLALPPIRINPEALRACAAAPSFRWAAIRKKCAVAERELKEMRARTRRAARVRRLIAALAELMPGQPVLALAADDGKTMWELQSIAPADPGGVPSFDPDDASIAGDGRPEEPPPAESPGEPDETTEEQTWRPGERQPLEPTWVLAPVPVLPWIRPTLLERPPLLSSHLDAVENEAEAFVRGLGLPAPLAAAVTLAARFHDVGKADPRLQAFFRNGVHSPWEAPIAKSVFGRDRARSRIAGRLAGMPRRLHHERASVAIVVDALEREPNLFGDSVDPELVVELIGGHHGRACPMPAAATGGAPPTQFEMTHKGLSGSASGGDEDGWERGAALDRFFEVRRRYGAWTVAYLQALVVLADWAASGKGE